MTSMNFSIDIDRVQSSVQAAIRPAVEKALAAYDIEAAIVRFLNSNPPQDRMSIYGSVFGYDSKPRPLIDTLIETSVREIAKEYVANAVQAEQPYIEQAFKKMMDESRNELVKRFAAAAADAIKRDWNFSLKVDVQHESGDDDD